MSSNDELVLVDLDWIKTDHAETQRLRAEGQNVQDKAYHYSGLGQLFYYYSERPSQTPALVRDSFASISTTSSGLPSTPRNSLYNNSASTLPTSTTESFLWSDELQDQVKSPPDAITKTFNKSRRGWVPNFNDIAEFEQIFAIPDIVMDESQRHNELSRSDSHSSPAAFDSLTLQILVGLPQESGQGVETFEGLAQSDPEVSLLIRVLGS